MRKLSVALSCAAALVMGGCATLQQVSSGQTGCSPEEIAVSNDHTSWNTRTWTAQCRGRTYQCSAHQGGQYSTAQVACAPREEAVASRAAAPAADGCTYDTQCKGERVCVKHECVDPSPRASSVAPASGTVPDAPATAPAAAQQL